MYVCMFLCNEIKKKQDVKPFGLNSYVLISQIAF